jgi:hypothetical protein
MMTRKVVSLFAAILVACGGARASAVVVLGDFEATNVPGSTGPNDGFVGQTDSGGDGMGDTTATVGFTTSAAITNKTGARAGTVRSGGHNFWAFNLNNTARPTLAAEIAANRKLMAEVFFVASSWTDPEGNWGQWTKVAVQSEGNGWTESPDPTPALNWNAGLGNLGGTLTWDLSAVPITDTSVGAFAQIIFSINYARNEYASTGSPAPLFVIDNIRLVPEPSSVALLGAGGLGLGALRRRRR